MNARTPERLGVTVGKFYPPHLGHAHLIRRGAKEVDRLVVIVAEHPEQALSGKVRAGWLRETFPSVEVVVTPDDLPEEPTPWAERAIQILGRTPDVAFTSEEYGVPWAEAMNCAHVAVDGPRGGVPIRATQIRVDLAAHFERLVPPARRDLAVNVVTVGVESSGTTTLAEALADRLATVVVPEYGREYWVERASTRPGEAWTTEDFVAIATEHHARGRAIAQRSTGVTVWDTDALATAVWHRRYLGTRSPEVEAIAAAHRPDLYVLTRPDFAFVQDGTREDGSHRAEMHGWFVEALRESGVPWIEVGGGVEARLDAVVAALPAVAFPAR